MITPEIIGIIGNTHGVSDKRSPKPKNVKSTTNTLPDFIVSAIESVSESSLFCFCGFCSISSLFFTAAAVKDLSFEVSISNLKALVYGS